MILQSALLYTSEMCMMIFLGTFSKFQRATIGFIVSVHPSIHPSVCMEERSSNWTDFHEI
jgi:hypothetical protein